MRVSWQWLSQLVDLSSLKTPEQLAEILTRRGLEVEAIERLDRGFEKVITAQILERAPHPQADRLSLCKVTTGIGEPLEIVCGAQNMKTGDKVALAQIGAELPNGLKIALSKIRGVTSNGMLCSEEELKLKDKSEGILILPAETPLGKSLAEILGLHDTIFHFKLTANRGDCLSHFGMAREIGAALGVKPKRPEAKGFPWSGSPISISLDAGESGPQFLGCLIEGVKIGPSPEWVVKRLEHLGSRSINNVVDASNLVMLEMGQPLHAYDADQIRGGKIHVRLAKTGESLPLLDGQTIALAGTELVIADSERVVALAGVMGGGNSEVQPTTTRLFLECAEFSPSLVRRAASKHQRRTEAAHRFERGVDPQGLEFAMMRFATLVTQLAGGKVMGAQMARLPSRDPAQAKPVSVRLRSEYFEEFLGMQVNPIQAEKILTGLDCHVHKKASEWTVEIPSYRRDLSLPQDLAEEVARSIGYEKIPETIPALSSDPSFGASSREKNALLDRAKDVLVKLGFNESLNFAFTNKSWLSKLGITSTAFVINPLSEDHEALVPSLLPGLIKNALDNWHHHFGSETLSIRLFEIRPTFHVSGSVAAKGESETGVEERWKLSWVASGNRFASGLKNENPEMDFSDFKAVFEGFLESLGMRGVRFQPLSASRVSEKDPLFKISRLFHPGQSVEVLAGTGVAGYFGLLHPGTAKDLKTRAPLWVGELDWEAISKLARPVAEPRRFKPWSDFPPIERDFALVVRDDVTADKITQVALKAGKPLAKVAKIFDIYRGSQVTQGMTSVAVRVIFYDENRSLQEAEAEAASALILQSWKKSWGLS